MPKFAANLSMLFTEQAFLDRFERAAAAGFAAVEFQLPYAVPAAEIRARLDACGLEAVMHNLPAGDWDAGERGIACHPDRTQEFRVGVAQAIAYAEVLGVRRLNCLVGRIPPGFDAAAVHAALVVNLRHAARELAAHGIDLLVEPLNSKDVPGFLLTGTEATLAVLDEVGADNAFLQYDLYHMQRMEGELAATLERHLARIAHIQVADNPGRHEPGTGEIRFPFLFRHLDRIGYRGWVGCEYLPLAGTEAGLGWRERLAPDGRASTEGTE